MLVIIAGGRDFNNFDYLCEKCDKILSNNKNPIIISGTAKGADSLGEKYADLRGYQVLRFPANWEKHGKKAGALRNVEMAKYAQGLIAFWDGKSKGTKHMIETARIRRLKIRVCRYGHI